MDKATELRPGSLVLYKNGAARVTSTGKKKIEIRRVGGETLSVRHKDVELLHPGPLENLAHLQAPVGEVQVAWELLAGSSSTLQGVAELAYEEFTPSTAWAVWQLVDDGLYFQGTPEEVIANTPEEVAAEKEARAARAEEEAAWATFLERLERGTYAPEDADYLRDVEDLALERYEQSRVLRELGRSETRENAHALLLEVGYWNEADNPYPVRLGLATESPEVALPVLPEEEREDLTHLPAFAIDDAGSEDPDDAISLEILGGRPRLWVHVADVAALVPPGSPADVEARARGASLYLPEGTAQMLPPTVTERLALGLEEISPALSFGIDLNEEGEIGNVQVVPSRVRVTRLSYAEAEARLDEPGPLNELYQVGQTLEARREANGAIEIDLPEVKIRVVDGEVVIRPLPRLRSRNLVRETMLIAGEAVARFAQAEGIPLPYTTQEPPEPVELPTEGPAGQFALRRGFKRSEAGMTPGAHAGLGLDFYTQATSPLRRYLDLVVHQQLRAFLKGEALLSEKEIKERIGAAQAVRGDVRYAERLANEHWTLVYLLQNPEWQGTGVVVEQYGQRSKVLIPELDLEVQLYLRRQVPLDGEVKLAVSEVNLAERTAHFREA